MGKRGLPAITDKFIDRTENAIVKGESEGKTPSKTTLSIWNGYKINITGEVIGQKGDPLKHVFRKGKRSPFVVIKINRKDSNGVIKSKYKEERIDKLMGKHFGQYIEGYTEMRHHKDKKYIVVPKDGKWDDMSSNNLKYVIEKEYNLKGTQKSVLLQLIPFAKDKSDEEFAKLLGVSRGWVNKNRTELKKEGEIGNKDLNELVISNKTYKIYVALLECKGLKSNLDIAKKLRLRPQTDFEDKDEQDRLTDKVSRVRRKLRDKGLIKKHHNIGDVKEKLKKALLANRALEKGKRQTHAQIAETFGLKKEQVDNFSRTIKPKE